MDLITHSSHPPLILIIDDDRFMRVQLQEVMAEEGYRVEEAKNGEEGLALYTQMQPDIVLLDAVMPIMDGFTCCQKLQQLCQEATSQATMHICPPVLMITSLEDQKSVNQAFAVGAADYITKPIHWPVLRQRVRRLIDQHRLYLQLQATNQKLAEANDALQRIASLDSLTQVANRRRFDLCLQREWRRLAREHKALSLILADIDYFKSYNDTYGHQAGDRCLYQVAQAIQTAVKRPADVVARYGGEEFAVILPDTESKGAIHVAKEIREQVKQMNLDHVESPIERKVSLSLGVASLMPDSNLMPAKLIAIADQALYQAKASGRDCICLSTS
jgi:diguanylate cyclase (GGDEF)-like protein